MKIIEKNEESGKSNFVNLDYVKKLIDSGMCIIPTHCTEGKQKDPKWNLRHQDNDPSKPIIPFEEDKLIQEFMFNISGVGRWFMDHEHSEMAELDLPEYIDDLRDAMEAEYPGLFSQLVIVETPKGGNHICYNHEGDIRGNTKLAWYETWEVDAKGNPELKTLAETRGRGGYHMLAGSPAKAHPLNKPYKLIQGDYTKQPTLTAEQRQWLLDWLKSIDESPPKEEEPERKESDPSFDSSNPNLPSNIYAKNVSWEELLTEYGWKFSHQKDDTTYWTRPGKEVAEGHSASVNHNGHGLFYAWSTDGYLDIEKGYTKAGFLCQMKFNGKWEPTKNWIKENFKNNSDVIVLDPDTFEFESKPTTVTTGVGVDDLEKYKTDWRTDYLWQGNHKRITDDSRRKRIKSIEDVWSYIPKTGFFADYIRYHLPQTDAPVLFHLSAALSLVGHLLNRKVSCDGIRPHFWLVNVAESTLMRKSTSIKMMEKFLINIPGFEETLLPSQSFSMEGVYKKLGRKNENNEKVSLLLSDYKSKEKDAVLNGLQYTFGVGLFHIDELGGFLSSLGKEHNKGGSSQLTEFYDYGREWFDKPLASGGYFVYKPFISMLAASTVDWISCNATASDVQGGFFPRFLFFYQKSPDYYLPEPDAGCPDLKKKIEEHISEILLQKGEFTLSPEALDFKWAWEMNFVNPSEEVPENMKAWLLRLPGYAKKLAMVFQATDESGSKIISLNNMILATRLLGRIWEDLSELMKFDLAFDPASKDANKVKNFLRKRKDWVSLRDISRSCHFPAKTLADILATLLATEEIEEGEVKGKKKIVTAYRWVG